MKRPCYIRCHVTWWITAIYWWLLPPAVTAPIEWAVRCPECDPSHWRWQDRHKGEA